jgi:peptidyl-prolyl cis-trans isomerase A (cyclophilin A)
MPKNRIFALLGLCAASTLAQTPAAQQPAAQAPAREPGLYATIVTSMGPIGIKLYEAESPITVKNFIDLEKGRKPWRDPKTGQMVRRPLYNGTTFHRVIPNFMIQGGDPKGDGTGDVGFTIKDEFNRNLNFHRKGVVAMANIGEPNTGACQFFITVAAVPHLDGKHTIFGQVVENYDLVEKISRLKTSRSDKPVTPVYIKTIMFERVGPAPANDPLGPPAAKKAAGKKAAPKKK